MAEHALESVTVEAPVATCYAVICDFAAYPAWARDIKAADVVARDRHGRPLEVAFTAAAMGRSTSYTLRYDHSEAPHRIAWRLVTGDVTTDLDGEYRLVPVSDDPTSTEVSYELTVELAVSVPGFVKRRAEGRILQAALPELKARIEALA